MNKIKRFSDIPKFTKEGEWQCDYSLEYLLKFIDDNKERGLQLNPDFQRGHVWTEEQQIALLEFFLRGGKSGRILYFNCPDWIHSVPDGEYNDFVCVDGLQRITAIRRFINNEIPVFGSYYNEFEDKKVLSATERISVNINCLRTKKEVIQWYLEMNSAGVHHSLEELTRVKKLMEEV